MLKINTTITTQEGFQVQGAFGYLDIFILADNWVNLRYYKSEQDYIDGKAPLNTDLPSRVSSDLTAEEFWGTSLANTIHEKCKVAIEEITGANTVQIING